MKKHYFVLLILAIIGTLFILPATTARADSLNDWSNAFKRTDHTSVRTYGFALLPVTGGKVPHVAGDTVYVYVDSSITSKCGQDVIAKANEIWNPYIKIVTVSNPSDAHVRIVYSTFQSVTNPNHAIADVGPGLYATNSSYADGRIKLGGFVTIRCYDRFVKAPTALLDRTVAQRGRDIAHEVGHLFGLDDVYNREDVSDYPTVSNVLMGNGSIISYQDLNGLYIVKHNPWFNSGSYWYRWSSPGYFLTGLQMINNKTYYFNSAGRMLTDWQKIDGSWYYFLPGNDGSMVTGWYKWDGSWFYLDPVNDSGKMLLGWQKIGSGWFYFNPDNESGRMFLNWHKINGGWFYFNPDNESGRMFLGWHKIGNSWYYFNPENESGRMFLGWHKIGNSWY